jgi:hypothetical protein
VDREFQNAVGFEAHFGNTKRTNMLLDIHNDELAVEENEIQRV